LTKAASRVKFNAVSKQFDVTQGFSTGVLVPLSQLVLHTDDSIFSFLAGAMTSQSDMSKRLAGVVVPTLTPMDARGERLAVGGIASLAKHLVEAGVSALFLGGTTGESALLNSDELTLLTQETVQAVNGQVPIAVQVGANSTAATLRQAELALTAGADMIVAVTPYYFGHSDDELFKHYSSLALALSGAPIYVYSIPSRAGNIISPRLAARLAEVTNIVGMKDSSGSVPLVLELLETPLDIVIGNDLAALVSLRAGAKGMVSGPANVFPEPYVALYNAQQAGDAATALAMQDAIVAISHQVGHGARMDVLKGLAELRWGSVGGMRSPHQTLDLDERNHIVDGLYKALMQTSLEASAYNWLM
jgi:dihydrodipicolinate synthase/N-acetylneuraminate lyase